jgi:hypothetical protein
MNNAGGMYVGDSINLQVYFVSKFGGFGGISIVAGSCCSQFVPTTFCNYNCNPESLDGIRTNARFRNPTVAAVDFLGYIYVHDRDSSSNYIVRKISTSGVVSTISGFTYNLFSIDLSGNIIASYASKILKIKPSGEVTTIAGNGSSGYADGIGTNVMFNNPSSVAVDKSGHVYVADTNCIRIITPSGAVSTLAGYTGQGNQVDGSGTDARFKSPSFLSLDILGNIYVLDSGAIRKISNFVSFPACDSKWHHLAMSHTETTLIPFTRYSFDGEEIARVTESIHIPSNGSSTLTIGLNVNASNLTYFSSFSGSFSDFRIYNRPLTDTEILALSQPPLLRLLASPNSAIMPSKPTIKLSSYSLVCVDGFFGPKNTYFRNFSDNSWDFNFILSHLCSPCSPLTYSYLGSRSCSSCPSSIGAIWTSSSLPCKPSSILSSGPSDTVFYLSGTESEGVSAFSNINISSGISYENNYLSAPTSALILSEGSSFSVTPTIGSSLLDSLPTGSSNFAASLWVKCKPLPDNVLGVPVFLWGDPQKILRSSITMFLTPTNVPFENNVVSTIAGGSTSGYADGTGTNAIFKSPESIAVDSFGNVYVADNFRIRKISPFGVVTTFVGSGTSGYSDGSGTNSAFKGIFGLSVDAAGNAYVADASTIRKISPSGVVSTFAGNDNLPGYQDGPSTSARLSSTRSVAVDTSGNVYVSEQGYLNGPCFRKITASGFVTTLAGCGSSGYSDGIGTDAQFNNPSDIAVDMKGNVYVADQNNHRIRKIAPNGVVTTLAGSGVLGFADGYGTNAKFKFPRRLVTDPLGNLYVRDSNDGYVRVVSPSGLVTSLSIEIGWDIDLDFLGNIYTSDQGSYNRIRKISNFVSFPACDSKWHHLAMSHTETTLIPFTRYSFDGEEIARVTESINIPSNGSSTLTIGFDIRKVHFSSFSGSFSDFRIYNRPLTDTEMLALSQPPLTFQNMDVQPSKPTIKSSSYSWVCAKGSSGSSATHFRSLYDNSWYWSTGSPPICQPCSAGGYSSIQAASACSLCPLGTFGRNGSAFTSQILACQECDAGQYASQLGTLLCLDCPVGTWSLAGSSACSPCPDGFYSNIRGANSSSLCVVCPQGSYGGGGTISTCVPCPSGSFGIENLLLPPISSSIACKQCPAGSYSSSGALECTFCPVGFYSESTGSILCKSCPSGSYGVMPGSSNKTLACIQCPVGTFNELTGQTRISCTSCPTGTASNSTGASSKNTCKSCEPGTYSLSGDSSCTPCLPGFYSDTSNSGQCTPCPRNTYNELSGASSLSQCILCPSGTFTAVSGTSSSSDCVAGAYSCPRGTQSKTSVAKSLSDCIELVCPFPLQPSTVEGIVVASASFGSKCIGCAQGTFGSPSSRCSLCMTGEVCPGFMGVPLPNSSSMIALSKLFPSTWACSSDFQGDPVAKVSASSMQSLAPDAVTLDSGSLAVVFTGIGIVLLTFTLLAFQSLSGWIRFWSQKRRPGVLDPTSKENSIEGERKSISNTIRMVLESVDAFSLAHHLESGEFVVKTPTALGGSFTIAGLTTLTVLSVILALRRQSDNVLTQQSIAVLDASSLEASKAQPWSQHASLSARQASSSSSVATQDENQARLFRIRALVSGDSDASCGTLLTSSWAQEGLETGSIVYHSSLSNQPCLAGIRQHSASPRGQASIFQHTWTCSDCLFSSQTEFTFSLPYGCQSILLEVGSSTADEKVSIISINSDGGSLTGGLMSVLEWKVLPLLDVLNDIRPQSIRNSRRGYTLIDGGATVSRSVGEKSGNQSYSLFSPSGSSVTVKIALILQPYFSRTILSEKTSMLQLFTNIVGLAGIFSVFGILFQQADKISLQKVQKKGGSSRSLSRRSSSLVNLQRKSSRSVLTSLPNNSMTIENNRDNPASSECYNPFFNRSTVMETTHQSEETKEEITLDAPNVEAEHPTPWIEYTEGSETWFVSPTGESSWQLPSGVTSIPFSRKVTIQ